MCRSYTCLRSCRCVDNRLVSSLDKGINRHSHRKAPRLLLDIDRCSELYKLLASRSLVGIVGRYTVMS